MGNNVDDLDRAYLEKAWRSCRNCSHIRIHHNKSRGKCEFMDWIEKGEAHYCTCTNFESSDNLEWLEAKCQKEAEDKNV